MQFSENSIVYDIIQLLKLDFFVIMHVYNIGAPETFLASYHQVQSRDRHIIYVQYKYTIKYLHFTLLVIVSIFNESKGLVSIHNT